MNELDKLVKDIRKEFGEESVMMLKDGSSSVKRIRIGSPKIADLLGGGLPVGRVIELYGVESSGKTSLSCYLAGEVQKSDITFIDQKGNYQTRKGTVAFIDVEHAIDPDYAYSMGFDMSLSPIFQPESGEEALNIMERLIDSKIIDFIILDSIAALTPQAELDGEMGDQQMGLQARLMGKAMRKLKGKANKSNTTLLFINQLRMKIGTNFGNPETTPGGLAMKYYASIRLEVRKIEFINKNGEIIGLKSRLKCVKNKTAPPMKKCDIDFIFGEGLQYEEDWIDFAIKFDIVKQSGAWFNIDNVDKPFQGKHNVIKYYKENEKEYDALKKSVELCLYPKTKVVRTSIGKEESKKPIEEAEISIEEKIEEIEEEKFEEEVEKIIEEEISLSEKPVEEVDLSPVENPITENEIKSQIENSPLKRKAGRPRKNLLSGDIIEVPDEIDEKDISITV